MKFILNLNFLQKSLKKNQKKMSFRSKSSQHSLPGTKISIHNGLPMVSTGSACLDTVLGGGLPIGSLLLIKQDRFTDYSYILFKYFIAQGILSKNHIALISKDRDVEQIVTKDLMGISTLSESQLLKENQDHQSQMKLNTGTTSRRMMGQLRQNDSMNIAWRYNNLPQFSTQIVKAPVDPKYCATFDLTKKFSSEWIHPNLMHYIHTKEEGDVYMDLYEQLKELVQNPTFQ